MIVETGFTGPWRVDVTLTDAYAYKDTGDGHRLHTHTTVVRFPEGYKISPWPRMADLPNAPYTLAHKLAKQLTERMSGVSGSS